MAILIKGMEMPKSCLVCSCTDTEYGECVLDPEKRCPEDYHKRADWCPFIEIPEPHGRLIDADALSAELPAPIEDEYKHVRRIIEIAPTIIPSSEEK